MRLQFNIKYIFHCFFLNFFLRRVCEQANLCFFPTLRTLVRRDVPEKTYSPGPQQLPFPQCSVPSSDSSRFTRSASSQTRARPPHRRETLHTSRRESVRRPKTAKAARVVRRERRGSRRGRLVFLLLRSFLFFFPFPTKLDWVHCVSRVSRTATRRV